MVQMVNTCSQDWQTEFDSQDPHAGEGTDCHKLSSDLHMHAVAHIHMYQINVIYMRYSSSFSLYSSSR